MASTVVRFNPKADPAFAEIDIPDPGSGGFTVTSIKIANYTAKFGEAVPCDPSGGGFTVTLPLGKNDPGGVFVKVDSASNNGVAIASQGGQTIDGAASLPGPLNAWEKIWLVWDGVSNWMIFGQ